MTGRPGQLRIAETALPCTLMPLDIDPRRPAACPLDPGSTVVGFSAVDGRVVERWDSLYLYKASPHGEKPAGCREVYRWDSGRYYKPSDRALIDAGSEFLLAHGIEPLAFIIGNILRVDVRCDGTLWLSTQRIAGNLPASEAPMGRDGFEQEQVVVPLLAPVPMLSGAYLTDRVTVPSATMPADGGAVTG